MGAIVRHLGRKHNLYGKNLAESDRSEFNGAVTQWIQNFEKLLDGNDYFVGDSASIADFTVFNLIDNFVKPLSKKELEESKLESWRQRVASLPNVSAYLSSDRRPALTMPPFFKVL